MLEYAQLFRKRKMGNAVFGDGILTIRIHFQLRPGRKTQKCSVFGIDLNIGWTTRFEVIDAERLASGQTGIQSLQTAVQDGLRHRWSAGKTEGK